MAQRCVYLGLVWQGVRSASISVCAALNSLRITSSRFSFLSLSSNLYLLPLSLPACILLQVFGQNQISHPGEVVCSPRTHRFLVPLTRQQPPLPRIKLTRGSNCIFMCEISCPPHFASLSAECIQALHALLTHSSPPSIHTHARTHAPSTLATCYARKGGQGAPRALASTCAYPAPLLSQRLATGD